MKSALGCTQSALAITCSDDPFISQDQYRALLWPKQNIGFLQAPTLAAFLDTTELRRWTLLEYATVKVLSQWLRQPLCNKRGD